MNFAVILAPEAIQDTQEIIDYYDEEQPGLGEIFENTLHDHLSTLQKAPYFQQRYGDVRCFPLKKFPYMIHYTVDEKQKSIIVRAIFHTSLDPKEWDKRR